MGTNLSFYFDFNNFTENNSQFTAYPKLHRFNAQKTNYCANFYGFSFLSQ